MNEDSDTRSTSNRGINDRGAPPLPPPPPSLKRPRFPVSPQLQSPVDELKLGPGEHLEIKSQTFRELGMEDLGDYAGFTRYKIYGPDGKLVRHFINFWNRWPPPLLSRTLPPIGPSPSARGLPMIPITPQSRGTGKHRSRESEDGKQTHIARIRKEIEKEIGEEVAKDAEARQRREWIEYAPDNIDVQDALREVEDSFENSARTRSRKEGISQMRRSGMKETAAQREREERIMLITLKKDCTRIVRELGKPRFWRKFWQEVSKERPPDKDHPNYAKHRTSFDDFRAWWKRGPGVFYFNVYNLALQQDLGEGVNAWSHLPSDLKILWPTKEHLPRTEKYP